MQRLKRPKPEPLRRKPVRHAMAAELDGFPFAPPAPILPFKTRPLSKADIVHDIFDAHPGNCFLGRMHRGGTVASLVKQGGKTVLMFKTPNPMGHAQ